MEIFKWERGYAIGVAQIDEHHKHLVGLLNRAHEGFLKRASQQELKALVQELIDYATYHFSEEEQRMQGGIKYPQMAIHKREHDLFIKRVVEMDRDAQRNKTYSLEILQFLKEWLMDHILHTDIELGRAIRASSREQ